MNQNTESIKKNPQDEHAEWDATKEELKKTTSALSEKGEEVAKKGKNQICEGLEALSQSLRNSSEQLQRENNFFASSFASAGSMVDKLAERMQGKDYQNMVNQTRSVVRDHPALVLGGLFVAGVALSRFIKAAGGPSQSQTFTGSVHAIGEKR